MALLSVLVLQRRGDTSGPPRAWARRTDPARPLSRRSAPWLVLAAAVLGLELFSLFAGPRAQHPTLSSLYDAGARWRAVKAAAVLLWVWGGWWLVRR